MSGAPTNGACPPDTEVAERGGQTHYEQTLTPETKLLDSTNTTTNLMAMYSLCWDVKTLDLLVCPGISSCCLLASTGNPVRQLNHNLGKM